MSRLFKIAISVGVLLVLPLVLYGDEIIVTREFGSNINDHEVFIKRVQFDSDYFLGIDGYYSVAPKVIERSEQRSKIESIIQLIKEEKNPEVKKSLGDVLKKLIDCIVKESIPNNYGKHDEPSVPDNPDEGQKPDNPNPDGPSQLDVKVFDLFVKRCAKCHHDDKNGITLVKDKNGDGQYDTLVLHDLSDRVEIYDRVFGVDLDRRGKARMPKGKPLSNEEVKLLYLWLVEESDRIRESK